MLRQLKLVVSLLAILAVPCMVFAEGRIGQSEVTFSGGVEEQFSGGAMHVTQELASKRHLLLLLYRYESDADFTTINLVFDGDTAAPGTYELREDDSETEVMTVILKMSEGATLIGTPAPGEAAFVDGRLDLEANAKAGELVIESAGGSTISGTLNLRGRMLKLGDTESQPPFVLAATFEAVAGEASDLPGMLGQSAFTFSQ